MDIFNTYKTQKWAAELYAFKILLVCLLLVVGCLDLFLALLLFWRIPSTQQGRPNDADGQNNIQLMTNGHEIEVDKLHRYPEYPLRLNCHIPINYITVL